MVEGGISQMDDGFKKIVKSIEVMHAGEIELLIGKLAILAQATAEFDPAMREANEPWITTANYLTGAFGSIGRRFGN